MIKKMLWVLIEKGSISLIQFISLIILGRLLTPTDYGIYGIMMIFITLSDTLVDSGFGGALVNKKNIVQEDINTLFFANSLFSLVLYFAIYLLAPLLEDYYQVENLSSYFRVLGTVVIFYALSIVQNAIIMRELRFKFSATLNLVATVLSAIIAIILAYYGWGVWSLIIQVVIQSILVTTILWMKSNIKISCKISKDSFKGFWDFGSNILGANILYTIVNNICNSIIPKIGTITQSGLYSQAVKLNNVPVNVLALSIDKCLFPILSREKDTKSMVSSARVFNRYLLFFIIPLFPLISLVSRPLISLLLGEKWIDASLYLSIISWSGIALIWQATSRNILKSLGYTKYILYVEVLKSVLMLSIIFISLRFGVFFLVLGVTISYFLGAIIWSFCLNKKIAYSYKMQFDDIKTPLILSTVIFCLTHMICPSKEGIASIIIMPLGYIVYLLICALMSNNEMVNAFRNVKKYLRENR